MRFWRGTGRRRGRREALSHFEVYDTDNRMLGKSDPNRLKFRPGELLFSTWAFTASAVVRTAFAKKP